MKFTLSCTRPIVIDNQLQNIEYGKLYYDNQTSQLFDETGKLLFEGNHEWNEAFATSEETPAKKSKISTLKIQLGLSCNYSCSYCSQRFVPNAPETNKNYVDRFVKSMANWMPEAPKRIEFWGGEPLVYWKTLEPLAKHLRARYPQATFLMITNGSLLTDEIIDWIDVLDINVGVSHDGPGQHVRGPDPLDNSEIREMILKLFKKRAGRVSFNAMVHRSNLDRVKIRDFFKEVIGHEVFIIGEGGIIDAYDEGGFESSLQTSEEHFQFRSMTMMQLRNGDLDNYHITKDRLKDWEDSITKNRPASAIGQKCGMDRDDQIAVDLRGNVLTCQNVSAVSTAPNGRSHLIGHVNNLEKVRLTTATHWKFRDECSKCPVLQACRGSCMFLKDELFKKSCDNSYSDHIPFFAAAIEKMTGWLPFKVEAENYELPSERQDIFGQLTRSQ